MREAEEGLHRKASPRQARRSRDNHTIVANVQAKSEGRVMLAECPLLPRGARPLILVTRAGSVLFVSRQVARFAPRGGGPVVADFSPVVGSAGLAEVLTKDLVHDLGAPG